MPEDLAAAASLYRKACNGGLHSGCTALAKVALNPEAGAYGGPRRVQGSLASPPESALGGGRVREPSPGTKGRVWAASAGQTLRASSRALFRRLTAAQSQVRLELEASPRQRVSA